MNPRALLASGANTARPIQLSNGSGPNVAELLFVRRNRKDKRGAAKIANAPKVIAETVAAINALIGFALLIVISYLFCSTVLFLLMLKAPLAGYCVPKTKRLRDFHL